MSVSSIPEDQLPDLSHLTETERNRIMDVLKRDERLNKRLNDKFLQLKQEIDLLESRSVDMPSEHIENATNCARCLQAFGYFFNTGELCPQCGYKVCQSCRVNQAGRSGIFFIRPAPTDKPDWLCILCHKYNEYLMQTGEWIHLGQESRTLKSALRNHLASTSIDAAKLNLTGSQLVKISLFPNKKNEIIQELEQSNFKRSSLSKRYSMIKKSKSNSLTPQTNGNSNDKTSEDGLSMISLKSPTTSSKNEVFFHYEKKQQHAPSVSIQPPSSPTPKPTLFEVPQLTATSTTTTTTTQKPKPRNLFFVNQLPPQHSTPTTSTPNAENSSVLNRSANLSIKALASNISYQVSKFAGDQSASNATLTSSSQDKNESEKRTASSQNFSSWESSRSRTAATKAEEENFDDDFASVTSSEVDTTSTKSETRLNKLAAAASLASAANKTSTTSMPRWQASRTSGDTQANITASSAESSSNMIGQRLTTMINMPIPSSNKALSNLDITQPKSSSSKLNATTTTTTTTTSGEETNVSQEEKTPPGRVSINKRMSTSLSRLIRGRAGSSFKLINKNKNNTDNNNNNNNEQDDEFAQIDQVFAKARAEKLKNEQRETVNTLKPPPLGDKANQNRSQPFLNPGKLFGKNTTTNSENNKSLAAKSANNLYEGGREMSVDPEEEYLKQAATTNENTNQNQKPGNSQVARFNTFNYRTMPDRIKNNSTATKMEKAESMRSVNETIDSNIAVRGKIRFQITYETLSSNLSVHIFGCENLASLNSKKEICDPYVKVYLMPGKDKNNKRKTSTKKNTINPIFEETLRYTISSSKLVGHKLWLSVWHHDKFGKNKFLGEIMIPLDGEHLKRFTKLDWHELEPKKVDIESFYQKDNTNNRLIIVRV